MKSKYQYPHILESTFYWFAGVWINPGDWASFMPTAGSSHHCKTQKGFRHCKKRLSTFIACSGYIFNPRGPFQQLIAILAITRQQIIVVGLSLKQKLRFAFKDHGHGFVNELEGLSQQPCMQADLHMSNQLSRPASFFWISQKKQPLPRQLFCNKESEPGSGHDLVSTNIQRGRC